MENAWRTTELISFNPAAVFGKLEAKKEYMPSVDEENLSQVTIPGQ